MIRSTNDISMFRQDSDNNYRFEGDLVSISNVLYKPADDMKPDWREETRQRGLIEIIHGNHRIVVGGCELITAVECALKASQESDRYHVAQHRMRNEF